MNRGSGRTLVALLIVFGVLLLIGLAISTKQVNEPPPTYPFRRVFTDMQTGDISAVRLRSPQTGESFVMVRGDNGQWITPSGVRLTDDADLIARTLAGLPYDRVLPLAPGVGYDTYGFDPDGELVVEILMADGSAHAVAVGGLAGGELTYYALVDNQTDITLLLRPAVDYLITQLRNPPTA